MIKSENFSNVILFTRGTKGDLYPFLKIGSDLRQRGCKVTLLSNYCYEDYAINEKLSFMSLDNKESFDLLNNDPTLHSSLSAKFHLFKYHIIANLRKEVEVIKSAAEPLRTVILAHSNDYLAPLLASEVLNAPLYICVLAPSYIHGFALLQGLLSSLSDEINLMRGELNLPYIKDWNEWLNRFEDCFAIWPAWFSGGACEDAPAMKHLGFFSVNQIEKNPLQSEILALVKQKKIVVITHGTSRPFHDNYFVLAIEACKGFNYNIIVSTPFRTLLPQELPENILWVEYCSFNELLPFASLIIHHGGIGTTSESIAHEVPQLVIGQGYDRQHNGRLAKSLGVGDWISQKELNVNTLYHRINDLLNDGAIKQRCRELKTQLYNQDELMKFYATIAIIAKDNDPSLPDKSADSKIHIELPVPNDFITSTRPTDVDINRSMPISKRNLLLKIMKNKTKGI